MEITKRKIGAKFYLRLRLDGRTLHETECLYDQVEYFEHKFNALYNFWTRNQHKAVLNRWQTFVLVCETMQFPTETGAHAAIFSMVNYNAYPS